MQIDFLLEEPSAEAALEIILPKILSANIYFTCYSFEGKRDLLRKLPVRLKGYKPWIPDDWRIISARCRFWDEIQPDPSRKFSSG